MSWQDLVAIAPLVVAILTAVAVLIVDLIRPGRDRLAVGTALIGLALTTAVTLATGSARAAAAGRSTPSTAPTRSTR